MKKLVFLFLFTLLCSEEKPMVIVVPSYNNADYYELNIDSVLNQAYKNYRVIYVNDNSSDKTGELVEEFLLKKGVDYRTVFFDEPSSHDLVEQTNAFIELVNQESHFFTLINNRTRTLALANLYRSIHSCNDREIVLLLDGDDWFYEEDVLQKLNETYSSQEVWFTHGTLIEYPLGNVTWNEPIPDDIIQKNAFRTFRKCPSHLRTFYSWIFKKIALEDLLYENQFFPMAWDMSIMFPIAEMAGERHAFIEDINYVYNMATPLNDNKVNADLQNKLDRIIRNMPRYQRLDRGL